MGCPTNDMGLGQDVGSPRKGILPSGRKYEAIKFCWKLLKNAVIPVGFQETCLVITLPCLTSLVSAKLHVAQYLFSDTYEHGHCSQLRAHLSPSYYTTSDSQSTQYAHTTRLHHFIHFAFRIHIHTRPNAGKHSWIFNATHAAGMSWSQFLICLISVPY